MGKILTSYGQITNEIPELRNTMVISPKCYLIVISIKKLDGYYHFPPPPGPLIRGFLSSFYMENYSTIELPVCGGETGPLTLFADLGHRHLFGPRL